MATAAQQLANRLNARRSAGPRTPEGKDRSSRNAVTHGLTARHALLPSEDAEEFDRHLRAFTRQHRPEGPDEHFLVQQMAEATWRLRRVRKLESDCLAAGADLDTLLKLSRYESAIERGYYRAARRLAELQRQSSRDADRDFNSFIDSYINAPPPGIGFDSLPGSQPARGAETLGAVPRQSHVRQGSDSRSPLAHAGGSG